MKAELTKDGWLNLTPETQEEYDILMFMSDKKGVFRSNSYTYKNEPSLGNCTFNYTATAGWTFDKNFIDRMLNK